MLLFSAVLQVSARAESHVESCLHPCAPLLVLRSDFDCAWGSSSFRIPKRKDVPSGASSIAFLMMYSAYKLNKQGDNIQP